MSGNTVNEARNEGGSVTVALPEWQPIETAPTDKEVLGFQSTRGDHEDRMAVCWPVITSKGAIWFGAGGLTPTHWQPLPAPPVQS